MKAQLINFVIPKELLQKIDTIARKEAKSRSEMLREAARNLIRGLEQRDRDFELIEASAKSLNLGEDEAVVSIDKIRKKLSLNK